MSSSISVVGGVSTMSWKSKSRAASATSASKAGGTSSASAQADEQLGRGLAPEPLGAQAVADDLGAELGEELVAPAVVAVVVGVDQAPGRARAHTVA